MSDPITDDLRTPPSLTHGVQCPPAPKLPQTCSFQQEPQPWSEGASQTPFVPGSTCCGLGDSAAVSAGAGRACPPVAWAAAQQMFPADASTFLL